MDSLLSFVRMAMSSGPLGWLVLAAPTLQCVLAVLWWRQRRQRMKLSASLAEVRHELGALEKHDSLTGLLTRAEFENAITQAVQLCDVQSQTACVLYAGLDGLRSVNEVFGHDIGDGLLKGVAERMQSTAGPQAVLGRIAGDEFGLVVPLNTTQARALASRLVEAVGRPMLVKGQEVRITVSVGIAAYPEHATRAHLLGHASMAMAAVKRHGGGAFALFVPNMGRDRREQAELLRDLRQALDLGQLELVYQPKIDATSLQITAAEALIRWRHPTRGLVSPGVFVPLAERYGLIGSIGSWVIEEACRQSAAWREDGLRMRVAVNISGHQMRNPGLVQHLEGCMRRHRVPASRFTCEITETVAMEDTAVTQQTFEALRRLGVHVSIDDFGTGHSSLAVLRKLPAAELKIDQAFVSDLGTSEEARTVARSIIQLAKSLDLHVVAEGVETEEQRDLLVEMGCDELQGYLFAKPMPPDALVRWAHEEMTQLHGGAFRASLFSETKHAALH